MVEQFITLFALFLLMHSNPHCIDFFTHQEAVFEAKE